MSFPLDDILLGPDNFGRLHRLDMVIGHTGEEPGFTRDYAVKTATWQLTNPGSYSFRIYDRASDPRGVMLNVPYLEASGGINPASSYWAPERYPWLASELAKAGPCPVPGCPGPYRNPTMHAGQISFVGRRADLDAGKAPANYLPDARALIAWYEKHPLRGPAPLVVLMHGHLQSNRSDWGAWMQSRLAPRSEEDPLMSRPWRPRTETWTTGIGPDAGRFYVGTEEKHFTAAVEVTTCLEQFDVVNGVVVTPMDRLLMALYPDPILGPEVLVFPRSSLTNPRNGRSGLPSTGAEEIARLQGALDSANKRTATVKTSAAAFLRKGAVANRDTAAGLEAAAKNVESL